MHESISCMRVVMDDLDQFLEKVNKVLNMQTSSNTHEAEVAAGKIQEMLLRYNREHDEQLSIEDVHDFKAKSKDEYTQMLGNLGGVKLWRKELIFMLAGNMLCRAFTGVKGRVRIIGKPSNIRAVYATYEHISQEMYRIAAKAYFSGQIVADRRWTQDYYRGMIEKLRERMEGERKLFESQSNTNMALIVRVEEELDEAEQKFVKRAKAIMAPRPNEKNYALGYRDGEHVS